jgi:Fe-S cluster assembly protein SufD
VPVLQTSNFNAQVVSSLPGPEWLRESRLASWERFVSSGLPRESEEIWRYSRVEELDLDRYAPCSASAGGRAQAADLPAPLRDLVEAAGADATVLVSRNGGPGEVVRPQSGLAIGPAASAPFWPSTEPVPASAGPHADVWTALNGAFVEVPWRVRVSPGVAVGAPLVVVHWIEGDGAAVFPRLEVEVAEGASLQLVEVVASADADVLVVPLAQLGVGPGARLDFGHLQLLGAGAWELGNQVSRVARDATLRSMTVALGGEYARVRTDSVLEGPGGDSELLAAYLGGAHQMHDLRTVQLHAAPRTRSNLLFKGAVANKAHSVYSGLIRVEKGAKGTNAFQTNRNLVLSEGAQADSVPNLEIEDNDVRCSHASAVGPIDESQLFYLESRGVPTPSAELLIALGFLDDVLVRFPARGMRPGLRQAVAAKLRSVGLGERQATGPGLGTGRAGPEQAGGDGR